MMHETFRKLRRAVGRIIHPKAVVGAVDTRVPMARLGSDYGGWAVTPDVLGKGSVVYSFGIGEDASFDAALIDRFGCTVHGFDPTPRSVEWVRRERSAGRLPASFVLHEYGVAEHDGVVTFYAPENPSHVSHTIVSPGAGLAKAITAPVRRLTTIMNELGHDRIDLLKMDIEGAEYGVVEDLVRSRIPVRQLLVEYHHRFPSIGEEKTRASLALLRAAGYGLFCISESAEEYSFIRAG